MQRTTRLTRSSVLAAILAVPAVAMPATAGGQIFATNDEGFDYNIREYTTSGATVNASLIPGGLSVPLGIAMSGSNLFVVNQGLFVGNSGTIGEYTTSGATINASLIMGLNKPCGIAVSGGNLFVTNEAPARLANTPPRGLR